MKSVQFWFILSILSTAARIGLAAINYNFACQDLGDNGFVPRWVWQPDQLAYIPTETFPVLDYIQAHYEPVAKFDVVVYLRRQLTSSELKEEKCCVWAASLSSWFLGPVRLFCY